jgi:nucleotide-binding universal stress UspA family protein
LVAATVGWVAIGVFQAMALGRRGFDGFGWFLIGMVLGPMSVPIAVNCVRKDQVLGTRVLEAPATVQPVGALSVLLGYDGSMESRAAAAEVVELLGSRIGRLGLVSVVPFDAPPDVDRSARARLEELAADLEAFAPTVEIVHGHPATALARAADDGGFDLLAIGTTGHGHAHLFGSAAKELAHRSTVPVLLAGQAATIEGRTGAPALERT